MQSTVTLVWTAASKAKVLDSLPSLVADSKVKVLDKTVRPLAADSKVKVLTTTKKCKIFIYT